MSKDYTKYSKKYERTVQTAVGPSAEIIIEDVETAIVEDAEIKLDIASEDIKPEPVVEAPTIGVVSDCVKLNVRKAPNPNSEIVCELNSGTEVEIDEINSTNDYYKVSTVFGVEGFCMKKYIAIK